MSDRRTLRWDSGRLVRSSLFDFWQISPTVKDPSIPNLPLETPDAPASGFNIAFCGATYMAGVMCA